jgi:hypothetical protein
MTFVGSSTIVRGKSGARLPSVRCRHGRLRGGRTSRAGARAPSRVARPHPKVDPSRTDPEPGFKTLTSSDAPETPLRNVRIAPRPSADLRRHRDRYVRFVRRQGLEPRTRGLETAGEGAGGVLRRTAGFRTVWGRSVSPRSPKKPTRRLRPARQGRSFRRRRERLPGGCLGFRPNHDSPSHLAVWSGFESPGSTQ